MLADQFGQHWMVVMAYIISFYQEIVQLNIISVMKVSPFKSNFHTIDWCGSFAASLNNLCDTTNISPVPWSCLVLIDVPARWISNWNSLTIHLENIIGNIDVSNASSHLFVFLINCFQSSFLLIFFQVNGWLADRSFGIQVTVVKLRRSTLFLCMIRRCLRQTGKVCLIHRFKIAFVRRTFTVHHIPKSKPSTLIREQTCDVEFTDRLNNIRSAASRNNWKTSRVRGKYFNFICSLTPKMRPLFSPVVFLFFSFIH